MFWLCTNNPFLFILEFKTIRSSVIAKNDDNFISLFILLNESFGKYFGGENMISGEIAEQEV